MGWTVPVEAHVSERGTTTAETICGLLAMALLLAFVLVLVRGWP